ncbi:hypothetical protein BaRGS_00022616 [Batillaria attramentaria]|uniref:Uncharacterized protein n=1 Tax=Batillaria attramentaria TaxID=370345 RepID=A0ABD0KG44_9CAEN
MSTPWAGGSFTKRLGAPLTELAAVIGEGRARTLARAAAGCVAPVAHQSVSQDITIFPKHFPRRDVKVLSIVASFVRVGSSGFPSGDLMELWHVIMVAGRFGLDFSSYGRPSVKVYMFTQPLVMYPFGIVPQSPVCKRVYRHNDYAFFTRSPTRKMQSVASVPMLYCWATMDPSWRKRGLPRALSDDKDASIFTKWRIPLRI